MAEDDPQVPIVCPDCDVRTEVPLSDVGGTLDRHNDERHGGETVAEVDPALQEELADIVAEDLGLL